MKYLLGPRQWLPFHQNPSQPVFGQEGIGPLEPFPNQWLCLASQSFLGLCALRRTFLSPLSSSFGTLFPFLMFLSLKECAHLSSAPWTQCGWMDSYWRLKCWYWISDPPVCTSVRRVLGLQVCTTTPGLCLAGYLTQGYFCMLGKHCTNWTTFPGHFQFC